MQIPVHNPSTYKPSRFRLLLLRYEDILLRWNVRTTSVSLKVCHPSCWFFLQWRKRELGGRKHEGVGAMRGKELKVDRCSPWGRLPRCWLESRTRQLRRLHPTHHKSLRSHSTQAPKQRACNVLLKKASYRGEYNLLNVVGNATGKGSVEDKGVRVLDKELSALFRLHSCQHSAMPQRESMLCTIPCMSPRLPLL